MSTIDWNSIANTAASQTEEQLHTTIASLTKMNLTEIQTFVKESGISNDNVIKVLQEINNVTASNNAKAEAISNINNGIGFLVSLAKKVV